MKLDEVRFDEKGLVPVVAQDAATGAVLMLAYANREALEETERSGEMVFFSRSRNALWRKGETSGNTLRIRSLRLDCDGDAVLALVDPAGPACHTGSRSCFFRTMCGDDGDADAVAIGTLWRRLLERRDAPPEESYTARLLAKGTARVAQKVGEEGVETALAVALGRRDEAISEASDLVYHLLVALLALDVPLSAVRTELESRAALHGGRREA